MAERVEGYDEPMEPMGPIEPVAPPHAAPLLEAIPEDGPAKPKRHMSEKQLENLARAREKAKISLGEKRERARKLKENERQLKEMKLKKKEDQIQAELDTLAAVSITGASEDGPVRYVRKPKKKKKPPTVVYYSSSSEDEGPPVMVYRKKPKEQKHQPVAAPAVFEEQAHDAAVEKSYNDELARLRREYMMKQVFP